VRNAAGSIGGRFRQLSAASRFVHAKRGEQTCTHSAARILVVTGVFNRIEVLQ
jgi:hypothetical protein